MSGGCLDRIQASKERRSSESCLNCPPTGQITGKSSLCVRFPAGRDLDHGNLRTREKANAGNVAAFHSDAAIDVNPGAGFTIETGLETLAMLAQRNERPIERQRHLPAVRVAHAEQIDVVGGDVERRAG